VDKSEAKVRKQISASILKWLMSGLLLSGIVLTSSCGSSGNSELTRNEKLWQSRNLTSYDFTLSRQCFCPEDWRGPVNIAVRDGMVTSVTYATNSQTAQADIFGDVDTINELFDVIRGAYEGKNSFSQKAETVNVTYHSELGYPLTIYIDVSTMIADEEQGYTVENLAAR
jgi:hypothetical protein